MMLDINNNNNDNNVKRMSPKYGRRYSSQCKKFHVTPKAPKPKVPSQKKSVSFDDDGDNNDRRNMEPRLSITPQYIRSISQPINAIDMSPSFHFDGSKMPPRSSYPQLATQYSITELKCARRLSMRCRICLDGDYMESCGELISPCQCSGTVGLVHVKCLEKWIQVSQTVKCEVCGDKYIMEDIALDAKRIGDNNNNNNLTSVSRDSLRQSISLWSTWSYNESTLLHDLLCGVIMLPCSIMGEYYLFTVLLQSNNVIISVLICLLAMFLLIGMAVWFNMTIKQHMKEYQNYRLKFKRLSVNINNSYNNRKRSTIPSPFISRLSNNIESDLYITTIREMEDDGDDQNDSS